MHIFNTEVQFSKRMTQSICHCASAPETYAGYSLVSCVGLPLSLPLFYRFTCINIDLSAFIVSD